MKKLVLLLLVVLLVLVAALPVAAEDPVEYTSDVAKDSHKVLNKWDLSGTFVAHPGYNWGGLAEGATWTYSVHIKEAMNGDYSVGSIHFSTGDIDVVGQVKATKRGYNWANIAAVGTADYNDTTYYFMFFAVDYAMWFCLSTTPYDTYWATAAPYPGAYRTYQLHSLNPGSEFTLDYKAIHELETP